MVKRLPLYVVEDIRARAKLGETHAAIAAHHEISPSAVGRIVSGSRRVREPREPKTPLAKLYRATGRTWAELAKAAGAGEATLRAIASGRRRASPAMRARLWDKLGIDEGSWPEWKPTKGERERSRSSARKRAKARKLRQKGVPLDSVAELLQMSKRDVVAATKGGA